MASPIEADIQLSSMTTGQWCMMVDVDHLTVPLLLFCIVIIIIIFVVCELCFSVYLSPWVGSKYILLVMNVGMGTHTMWWAGEVPRLEQGTSNDSEEFLKKQVNRIQDLHGKSDAPSNDTQPIKKKKKFIEVGQATSTASSSSSSSSASRKGGYDGSPLHVISVESPLDKSILAVCDFEAYLEELKRVTSTKRIEKQKEKEKKLCSTEERKRKRTRKRKEKKQ